MMKTAEESSVRSIPRAMSFGRYPKRITCQCNAEEPKDGVIAVQMNGRCPRCSQHYQVFIPKPSIIKGVICP